MADAVTQTGGWFVTGTDTGVGKTLVAEVLLHALRARGLPAIGMKPVASGCRRSGHGLRSDDAESLIAASGVVAPYDDVNPYAFEPAIAPHLAAPLPISIERIRGHFDRLRLCAPYIVVEGVGGWAVPINRRETMADVAAALALPIVLVVGLRLGCLNHALLTAQAIRGRGLTLAGWVANPVDPEMSHVEENITALCELIPAPLVARFARISPGHPHQEFAPLVDLDALNLPPMI